MYYAKGKNQAYDSTAQEIYTPISMRLLSGDGLKTQVMRSPVQDVSGHEEM